MITHAKRNFRIIALLALVGIVLVACQSLTNKNSRMTNPMMCDPETGMCEIPQQKPIDQSSDSLKRSNKKVTIIYYTDPICSSCWGIEPQLRKLKLEYGEFIEIDYRMGGLLPDWSYNSGGISKPSDVAHHWDEVSKYYDMPIDGDVWLEDPLDSSYPPSIAFKAAQLQDKEKAILFLRELRELVFMKKINIAKWENIEKAGKAVGLNVEQMKNDIQHVAKELFDQDLNLGRQLGVRGFPTLFFVNQTGKREVVYGSQPYEIYEKALLNAAQGMLKASYSKTWEALFEKYPTLTAKEYAVLANVSRKEVEKFLNNLVDKKLLIRLESKNGNLWKLKDSNESDN